MGDRQVKGQVMAGLRRNSREAIPWQTAAARRLEGGACDSWGQLVSALAFCSCILPKGQGTVYYSEQRTVRAVRKKCVCLWREGT